MANYSNLKNIIDQVVKTNGQGDITGENLNQTLIQMVTELGSYYHYAGVAVPSTNPGSPDQNIFYIATIAGTYNYFNGIVVPKGITVLKYDGTWLATTLYTIDTGLTPNSTALVQSGTVFERFKFDGGAWNVSAHFPTGGPNGDGKFTLQYILNNANTYIPTDIRIGGMWLRFVDISDNKYVQYKLMSNTFNTTPSNWQGVVKEPVVGNKSVVEAGGVHRTVVTPLGMIITDLQLSKNSGYISNDGTLFGGGTVGYYTDPISMNKGDIVVITTDAANVFSVISKYDNVGGNPVYTPLVIGKSRSIQDNVYICEDAMQIVFSGYAAYDDTSAIKINISDDAILGNIKFNIAEGQNLLGIYPVKKKLGGYGFVKWDDGTITENNTFFHTKPIELKQGETLVAKLYAATSMAAIASVDNNGLYTPLIKGRSASNLRDYEYTAPSDINVVISSYSNKFDVDSWYIKGDGIIRDIEGEISGIHTAISRLEETDDYLGVHAVEKSNIGGYVQWSDGEIVGDASSFFHTNPIQLNVGETIVVINWDANTMAAIALYDGNTYTPLVRGVNANSPTKYVYTASTNVQVVISGYQSHYNEFSIYIQKDGILSELRDGIETGIGIQLIDKSTNDGYVRWSDGTVGGNDNFFYTDPIPLNAGDRIIARVSATSSFAAFAKYELVEGQPVYTPLVQGNTQTLVLGDFSYVADSNMSVVISGYSAVLEQSTWYVELVNGPIENLNKRIDAVEGEINNHHTINIIGAFENIIAVGDSLTYCAVFDGKTHDNPFYPDPQSPDGEETVEWRQAYRPWSNQIAKICGIENSAIYAVPGYNPRKIWARYKDDFTVPVDKKTICVIYLGTNGGLTDTVDTDAPIADVDNYETAWANTYTGNMCKIIQKFINFGCKILLIIPHAVGGSVDLATTRAAVFSMAERFKCATVDDSEIYLSNSEAPQYHLYSSDSSEYNNLHYNDLGYAYFASSLIFKIGNMDKNNMKWIIP